MEVVLESGWLVKWMVSFVPSWERFTSRTVSSRWRFGLVTAVQGVGSGGEAAFDLMKSLQWSTWEWHWFCNLCFFYSKLMAIEKPGRKCCSRKHRLFCALLCCPNLVAGPERDLET